MCCGGVKLCIAEGLGYVLQRKGAMSVNVKR